jgi:hypothetical protein
MISESGRYLSILVSYPILLGCVGLILVTIALLKKGEQYHKPIRALMITLLILIMCVAGFLLYLAVAFGNPHASALPLSQNDLFNF